MGNRVVNPGNIENQADDIIRRVHNIYTSLSGISEKINEFLSSDGIAGKGWSAIKNHMEAYNAVIDGTEGLLDAVTGDCNIFKYSVGSEILREADIEKIIDEQKRMISQCEERIAHYNSIVWTDSATGSFCLAAIERNRQIIEIAQKQITEQEKKIEEIDRIEKDTDNLFTKSGSLLKYVNQGLAALSLSSENGFDMPANPEWKKNLNAALETLREETLKTSLGEDEIARAFSKDPVCLTTGNFIYKKADLRIGGNENFDFCRFYNSMDRESGAFGTGWIHSFECSLTIKNENGSISAELQREDGHVEYFVMAGSGCFIPAAGSQGNLVFQGNRYIYTANNLNRLYFDCSGKYIRRESKQGTAINFEYKDNRLISVLKTTGEGYYLNYDDAGQITSVADHAGRKADYEYKDKKLISVKWGKDISCRYEYDENGFLSEITNPSGVQTVKNKYDSSGRTTEQIFPDSSHMTYEYKDSEKGIVQKEKNGYLSRHFRDTRFRSIRNAYTDGDEEYEYNNRSQRVFEKDKNGNESRFSYDEYGDPVKIVDAEGTVTELEYTDTNLPAAIKVDGKVKLRNEYSGRKLRSQTDGIGRKTVFFYGSSTEPERIVKNDGSTVRFEYDGRGNIISVTNERGGITEYKRDKLNRLVEVISPNGNVRRLSYDAYDNITGIELPDHTKETHVFDCCGRISREEIDGRLYKEYEYNSIGKPSKITDAEGRITEYRYDEMWNLVEMIMPNGGSFKYSYSANDRLESIRDPEGGVVRFTYDGEGNLLSETDQLGNRVEYEYNRVNALSCIRYADGTEESFRYDGTGNIIAYTDRAGSEYRYYYDNADQLIKETDPLGNSREYSYTAIGRLETVTGEDGLATKYEYYPGGTLRKVTYPDGASETFIIDKEGNVTEHIDTNGYCRKYTFDCMNRLTAVSGENGEKTTFKYDSFGNLASRTDAENNTINYQYSHTGEIIKVIDEAGNETEFDYDSMGDLIEVRKYSADRCDIQITKYERNLMGRIIKATNPLGNSEIFKYDAGGRICSRTDRDGFETKISYNCRGNISEIRYADGRTVGYQYDKLGKITEIRDWNGVTAIERDALSRVRNVRYPKGDTISYTYGKSGQLQSLTYPDGRTAYYEYDSQMKLSKIRQGDTEISNEYDSSGRITGRRFSNGISAYYSYSKSGKISELAYADDSGIIDCFVYGYDTRNNIISINKKRQGIEQDTGTYFYEYNRLNQLKKVIKDGVNLRTYEYDSFGNRKSLQITGKDAREISYEYNSANQLIGERDGKTEICYSYDKRGNLIEKRKNGKIDTEFLYGAINRIEKSVNDITGKACEYIYNGTGQRVGERIGPEETTYITDFRRGHSNLLQKKSSREVQEVIWDGSTPAIMVGNQDRFLLNDHLGSPARLIDEKGEMLENFAFSEFGEAVVYPDESIQPFGFAGYMKDMVSETYFAQARQYIPDIGRFAAEDIVSWMADDPRSMNPYDYCLSSPVNLADRNGAFPVPAVTIENIEETGQDVLNYLAQNALNLPIQEPLKALRMISEITPISDAAAYFSKTSLGEEAISAVLNMDRDEKGVYHTRRDCWQKFFGYNDFYDMVFKNFTSAAPRKLPFTHNGEEYTLWMWKGDYFGLGAGAETGIYTGRGAHKSSYTDSRLIMEMSLYNKAGYRVFMHTPKQNQWWITGFNPDWQDADYQELTTYGKIDFSRYEVNGKNEFWEDFLKKYESYDGKLYYGVQICIDETNQTVYYKWKG